MRALVIGASGQVGRRAAGELARSDDVDELTVTTASQSSSDWIAGALGQDRDRIARATIDATRGEDVRRLAEHHDVVVNAAGPAHLTEIATLRGAIDAGVAYVSLCDDADAFHHAATLSGDAEQARITAVPGCGLAPGLTNLLARAASEDLDAVERIEISEALSLNDTFGSATLRSVIQALRRRDGGADSAPHLAYFPEPVGWVETFRCPHPEVDAVRRTTGADAVRFGIGLAERAGMDAVRLAAAAGAEAAGADAILGARAFLASIPPRTAPWSAVRVDVWGRREGRVECVSLGIADHIVNAAATTLARAAVEVTRGDVSGVRSLEDVVDARAFLRDIIARGVRVARLEPFAA